MVSAQRLPGHLILTDLRNEFETNGGVDGDVAADTKSHKRSHDEESRIGLTAPKCKTKRCRYQASEIEGPTTACATSQYVLGRRDESSMARVPTNNIDQIAPDKSA